MKCGWNRSLPDLPSSRRRAFVMALASTGAVIRMSSAVAAARTVEAFGADTWRTWQTDLARPAIVVFTTTYCPTCPEAFAYLAQANRGHKLGALLIAVVMDGDGQSDLPRHSHYAGADRLFAFSGPELALRYQIDPGWRGVTPYVALFGARGAPRFFVGKPTIEQLRHELRPE